MTKHERNAWIVAAIGLAAVLLAWLLAPSGIPHAWLAGFVAFSLWPLGSLALLYAHALTGGRWGDALRPGLLAGAAITPLLALLAIPVILTLPSLYPWARPEGASLANAWWLNVPLFAIRGAVSLIVWIALAMFALTRANLAPFAPFALLALALTVTAESIDLTMSLDPHFTSSAYGMIAATSAGTVALSCAILLSPPGLPEIDNEIGRLLLALTILWTYLDFMQILIVWQNDLVTQTPWYLARARGPAAWVMIAVSIMHSLIPFFALLSPTIRRSRRSLAAIALLLIIASIIRSWWTVLPAAPRAPGLVDLACFLFMAATAVAWGLHRSRTQYE